MPGEAQQARAAVEGSSHSGRRALGALQRVAARIADPSASGQPVAAATRTTMERLLGFDFSDVRVHAEPADHELASSLGAAAFTQGRDIYFGAGRYAPDTLAGQHLLAHELAHTIQQRARGDTGLLQRECAGDPEFCTPYPTPAEAASAEKKLRDYYLPADEAKFGATSRGLYESFLSRSPGDSLTPTVFEDPNSDIVQSFAGAWAVADDQDRVIDVIGSRLSRAVGGKPRPYTPTTMSVENFMSRAELDNRPINFSNPFSIAGHIAGAPGASDAGDDYRNVSWGNVTLSNVPLVDPFGYIDVQTSLHYEVFDAIDFCPGDCGSPLEKVVTIPMSRLEASGDAYDVPFLVRFVPESRSKRFFYS